LAIQKRTSEVWSVLGAVKTEFGKFGGMLQKVQKNLQNAGDQLEEVMGKRTRAIERRLRQVEELPKMKVVRFFLWKLLMTTMTRQRKILNQLHKQNRPKSSSWLLGRFVINNMQFNVSFFSS
jgi:Skp family chaperone for outer membrane proteins